MNLTKKESLDRQERMFELFDRLNDILYMWEDETAADNLFEFEKEDWMKKEWIKDQPDKIESASGFWNYCLEYGIPLWSAGPESYGKHSLDCAPLIFDRPLTLFLSSRQKRIMRLIRVLLGFVLEYLWIDQDQEEDLNFQWFEHISEWLEETIPLGQEVLQLDLEQCPLPEGKFNKESATYQTRRTTVHFYNENFLTLFAFWQTTYFLFRLNDLDNLKPESWDKNEVRQLPHFIPELLNWFWTDRIDLWKQVKFSTHQRVLFLSLHWCLTYQLNTLGPQFNPCQILCDRVEDWESTQRLIFYTKWVLDDQEKNAKQWQTLSDFGARLPVYEAVRIAHIFLSQEESVSPSQRGTE
jgi:hypothetical protein